MAIDLLHKLLQSICSLVKLVGQVAMLLLLIWCRPVWASLSLSLLWLSLLL